jgi:hypothetical protein
MKHASTRLAVLTFVLLLGLAGSSCRGVQIRKLEDRVAQLETRVAVLESQVERK